MCGCANMETYVVDAMDAIKVAMGLSITLEIILKLNGCL